MPDTFTNWLKFTPAGQVGYRRAYIDLPAFSYTGLSWIGASECVAQFNFSASQNFILLNRPTKPSGANYGLCIRYRTGEVVTRYKLWGDTAFMLNDDGAPIYNGQIIKKNFVLEIWSLNGLTVASQTTSIRMFSSVRSIPADITVTTDYALAIGAEFTTMANTNAYSIPAGLTSRWKADDVATGAVSSWLDTVNGTNLAQATGADQPTKVAASSTWLKGYVDFADGDNDFLSCVLPASGVWTGGSIYMVAEFDPAPASQVTAWAMQNGGVNYFKQSNNLFNNRFHLGGSAIISNIDPAEARVFRNYYTYPAIMGKQVDDGVLTTLATVQAIASPLTLELGYSSVDGTFGAFKVADFLLFKDKTLTSNEDIQLRQYLNNYHFGAIALPLTFNSGVAWLDNV